MNSLWYVNEISLTGLPKKPKNVLYTIALLEVISTIQSPKHAPPFPRHRFLVAGPRKLYASHVNVRLMRSTLQQLLTGEI